MTIELVTTDGIFALDGGEWEVTNNIWIVGDDAECVVFDAAHDHARIVEGINGRKVRAIVLTHGHNDHINAAVPLRDAVDAPILIHPEDRMLWDVVWPGESPDGEVVPGAAIAVAGHELVPLHTPGHSPGCCCFHDVAAGVVFSGDTLFCGGPGATGRSYSDEPTILRSIIAKLLALPPETIVHTGHGDSTTIGAERDTVLARAAELGLDRTWGVDGSQRRDATGELLELLLRERTDLLDALDAVHAAAYAATDPRLLDVARSRAALLIGVSAEPVDPPADERERACADVVEQSVLDVTGVTDAQIARLATHLGDDAAATFVTAALVVEQRLRMQAVFERLGLGAPA